MHKGRKHKFCTCQNEIIPVSNTNNGFTLRHLQSEASVLQRTLMLCLNAILEKELRVVRSMYVCVFQNLSASV